MNNELFQTKVGYDWANKKMLCKVYEHLRHTMNAPHRDKTWVSVIRSMLIEDGRLDKVNINGYYSSVRRILKDIGVIAYNGRVLVKGKNWDRFYSNEDWSWFVTDTHCVGYGKIVK